MTILHFSTGPTFPATLPTPRSTVYLPSVKTPLPVGDTGGEFTLARAIFEAMQQHPQQGRPMLNWCEELAAAAEDKCRDMAHEGWVGHVDPLGRGPNHFVQMYYYDLPDWYSQELDANNIESLAWGGDGDPAAIWQGWVDSPKHRAHVLGLNSFFAEQTQVGIGHYYLESSQWKHYWAIITAPPEEL